MGKGIAKHAYKSGILPITRSILKHPTTKQSSLINKSTENTTTTTGYAQGVKHPIGSTRNQPPGKFINVENLIHSTVPPLTNKHSSSHTLKQNDRGQRAQLRQLYLSESLRNEETRLLQRDRLIQKRQQIKELQQKQDLINQQRKKKSDLTIPSLQRIINDPLMRNRSKQETRLLQLKRAYNRDLINFKSRDSKLSKLLKLYYVADQFIINERQLINTLNNLIPIRKMPIRSDDTISSNIENNLGDHLFGTILGKPGLPIIKEYLK